MNTQQIVLGGGCFWCFEAVYQRVKGITEVVSGYAGGNRPNPTYEQVCSGATGHAEVVQVSFDADVISLDTILQIFWTLHNPTTLNRQGNDIGTEYRSIILYSGDDQKDIAEQSKENVAPSVWDDKIVTEIVPLKAFYRAEEYHQNFFSNHPDQAYCQFIINPKVSKLQEKFAELLID